MQRKIIEKVLKELETIEDKNKALLKAIEYLKIAKNNEVYGFESQAHNLIRKKIIKLFEGAVYQESKDTGFSKKAGFRPDIIILNQKEIIIVEIETNKKRAKNKINKISKNFDKIKALPLAINRKIKIVFCLTFFDKDLIKEIKEKNFEVYILKSNEIIKF